MPKYSPRKLRRKAARDLTRLDPSREDAFRLVEALWKRTSAEQKSLEGKPLGEAFGEVFERIFKAEAGVQFLQWKSEGAREREMLKQARLSLLIAKRLLIAAQDSGGHLDRETASALSSLVKPAEEEERRRLFSAQKAFVWASVGEEEEDFPRTQKEAAAQLIQSMAAALASHKAEVTATQAAWFVHLVFSLWLTESAASSSIIPGLGGPLAEAILSRMTPRESAEAHLPFTREAVKLAARKMEQAPLGPTSEEAIRQALIVFCQALGATPQEAGNWFRP